MIYGTPRIKSSTSLTPASSGNPPQRSFSLHPQKPFVRFFYKQNELVEIRNSRNSYTIFKHKDHYMIWYAASINDGIVSRDLEQGITEYGELVITRHGDEITVRLKDPKPKAAPTESQPKKQILQTMRDSRISIEMARILAEEVNPQNYEELINVYELQDGDILPGHNFVLGDKKTYDREILAKNLHPGSAVYQSPAIYQILAEAEEMGKKHKGDMQSLADKVADMVDENYSSWQGDGAKGALMTLGHFLENGGCCRHRAGLLRVALQKAGVRSRYVRGLQLLSGHAWVEVDVKGDGSYSYVIDPNMKIRGEKQKLESKEEKEAREWLKKKLRKKGVYHDDMVFFYVVDHRKSKDYMPSYIIRKNQFNVVWRRKS